MKLGLGTGSTASIMVEVLAERARTEGLSLRCAATSKATAELAARLGLRVESLDDIGWLDLTIDGADEVDPDLNLVKGRGGSLLREKMIEGAGERFVVIVDESKLVPRLGCTGAVPVEVIPFGAPHTLGLIRKVFDGLPGFHARLRTVVDADLGSAPFVTDNGNYIVEMFFEDGIRGDLQDISDRLLRITGVVEHGMFLGMATTVIVANKDGTVTALHRKSKLM